MARNDTDLGYRCTACGEPVRARVIEADGYTNGFTVGCECTTVNSCPTEMGQAETPERWVVERPECCRGVDATDMEQVYEEFADVRCRECGWRYQITGEFVYRPEDTEMEPNHDEDQQRLVTDGGTEQETGVRLDSHDEWSDEDYPENVLFADFRHGASQVAPDILRDSEVPKFSHEGGTTIIGPLDRLTYDILNELAYDVRRIERDCASNGDYESAEWYKNAKRAFENLAIEVRNHNRNDETDETETENEE